MRRGEPPHDKNEDEEEEEGGGEEEENGHENGGHDGKEGDGKDRGNEKLDNGTRPRTMSVLAKIDCSLNNIKVIAKGISIEPPTRLATHISIIKSYAFHRLINKKGGGMHVYSTTLKALDNPQRTLLLLYYS